MMKFIIQILHDENKKEKVLDSDDSCEDYEGGKDAVDVYDKNLKKKKDKKKKDKDKKKSKDKDKETKSSPAKKKGKNENQILDKVDSFLAGVIVDDVSDKREVDDDSDKSAAEKKDKK